MSYYTVLVADQKLPEVDYSGFVEMTVREMKELYPITENFPEQPWHSLPDDTKLLNAPDESAFGRLQVFEWGNYPLDLEGYNDRDYVYGVEGNWNKRFMEDLVGYFRQNVEELVGAELICFWAGDDEQVLKHRHLVLEEATVSELEAVKNARYVRVFLSKA